MPKLSVIVPVYNTEKYLRDCIDSILAQIFTDFELILVDDGSTDKSGSICDEYSLSDARIQVIHQNNGGVTAARKRGVEAAVGEYISFVDSDDWIDRTMYRDMLEVADSCNADVILCDMVVEQPGKNMVIHSCDLTGLFASEQLKQQIYPTMLFDFAKNKPGLSLCLCNKIFKSCLAKPVFAEFPKDIVYGEDALGSLLCLLRSNRVFIMEGSVLYHYRQTTEFFMRERSVSLLSGLSNFAKNTELQLSRVGFSGIDQLAGYITQVSLCCVRQILLFNAEYTVSQKLGLVRDYFEQAHICALLGRAEHLVIQEKMKQKILLVNRKRFLLLFVLFCGKEFVLRVRRYLFKK